MGRVISLVYTPKATATPRPEDRYHRVRLDSAELAPDHGIVGDHKGRLKDRQLNIMAAEMLAILQSEGFHTGPGEMGEQIVVEGIDLASLKAGDRLALGTAVIEMTLPRTGCDRFERIQGKPKGLTKGRLGIMARVVSAGTLRVGDPAAVIA